MIGGPDLLLPDEPTTGFGTLGVDDRTGAVTSAMWFGLPEE